MPDPVQKPDLHSFSNSLAASSSATSFVMEHALWATWSASMLLYFALLVFDASFVCDCFSNFFALSSARSTHQMFVAQNTKKQQDPTRNVVLGFHLTHDA
jgi:hypothetical protein